jgi:hypothetical protein
MYKATLDIWWYSCDAIGVLLQAHYFSPEAYFLKPMIYRLLSLHNLAPWVIFSFDIDLSVFGSNPFGFHIHQVLDIIALGAVSYMLLRLFVDPLTAFLAILLMLLTSPVAASAVELPMRHYLEGLVFMIVSLYCYYVGLRFEKRQRRILLVLSAFFYMLSVTTKEVYVPLVVFLFIIDRQPMVKRIKRFALHGFIAAGYCIWRIWMLGALIRGYDHPFWANNNISIFEKLLKGGIAIVHSFPSALFKSVVVNWAIFWLFFILLTYNVLQRKIRFDYAWSVLLCTFLPVLPVGLIVKYYGVDGTLRWFLVMGWLFHVFTAVFIGNIRNRLMKRIALSVVVICICFLIGPVKDYIGFFQDPKKFKIPVCAQFIWNQSDKCILVLKDCTA